MDQKGMRENTIKSSRISVDDFYKILTYSDTEID